MMPKKHRISILIVEDYASGRAMLCLTLRQAGYKVESASNGTQALELLKREHFDWMITDARMEPMNGFDLALLAKRLYPDLRILMMSADYSEENIRDYPIEMLFCKPVHTENLLSWLASRID